MEIPDDLRIALQEQLELDAVTHEQIMHASQKISRLYRTRMHASGKHYIQSRNEALAYAVARMPATFGAVYTALKYTLDSIGMQPLKISSLLDVGAGTGAATWAANELLNLDSVHCMEYEEAMKKLGEEMMLRSVGQLRNAKWRTLNIATDPVDIQPDLVIASYVINELEENIQLQVAEKLWSATNHILLFVEAGTPQGYHILNKIRSKLVERGAHILAPCPHENKCPMSGPDWCHFTCRVQRSRLHRLAKGGQAPYEDENYAYLALSKEKTYPQGARILRHPQIGKGHVKLTLCTEQGLKQTTYSKRDGDIYKYARKSDCGDLIEHEMNETDV